MSGKDNLTSRRRSKRRRGSFASPHFDVTLNQHTDDNFYSGLMGTIASGGLFIATYDTYNPGTRVSVCLSLPGGRRIEKSAIVEWVRSYSDASGDLHPGMGVVFERIASEDEQQIHEFMATREAIFYEAV